MIVYHGKAARIRQLAYELAAVLAGSAEDTTGIARAFLMSVGYAALSDIKAAFVIKSRGGSDEMGTLWPPLSPATIASRRVGQGDLRNPDVAAWHKAREKALRAIQKQFARQEGELFERFLLSMDARAARSAARSIAAHRATEQTGLTKVQALGHRSVEILRDTGALLNSLTPGVMHGEGLSSTYLPPTAEGGENQIFAIGDGTVTVGTNDSKAHKHQFGDPATHLPQRKFLPTDSDTIPQSWLDNWLDAGQQALVATAHLYFDDRRAA